jgi:CHASE1-domain containing sensor protein
MKSVVSRITVAGSMVALSAAPLFAQAWRPRPHSVPEIDASAGILAVAAVLAVMAFVWERQRRRAA